MEYRIKNETPEGMMCGVGACPAIYEGLTEVTPKEMCGIGSCPSTFESTREGKPVYLIIGKVVNPFTAGLKELKERIGNEEALIEVPRQLIDDKQK